MKRICLFAGYNYNNKISNYVIDYLHELKKYCESIYYLADGNLNMEELKKIEPYTDGAWVIGHSGYDFYSWHLLVTKYIGWEKLYEYDEVIFTNDSCMCVNSFEKVFDKMDKINDLDMWGLSSADNNNLYEISTFDQYKNNNERDFFISSYFLGFRKQFVQTELFYNFINDIRITNGRQDVYQKYELGLNKLTKKNKLHTAVWDEIVYRYSSDYMRDVYNRIKNGYPLLKVRIFVDNIGGQTLMDELAEIIEPLCDYPFESYIKEIQTERNITKQKKTEVKEGLYKKFKKFLIYIVPPFITSILRKRHILPYRIKVFFLNIIPPIFFDIKDKIKIWLSGIRLVDKSRFTFRPFDQYGGVYPYHIKNYEKIHEQRAQKIKDSKIMVIYFNVMRLFISGGMLSINRFIEHSKEIAKQRKFDIVLSNIPLNNACITNPYFEYSIEPIDFKYITKVCNPEKLLINIPEAYVHYFINEITDEEYLWLWSIKDLHINILNQNIELMPHQHYIEELRTICNNHLTITTAHQKYCDEYKAKKFKCPIYLLTPFLPEFYYKDVNEKEKIIILSPDENIERDKIIASLQTELPEYKLVTIKKMKLEDYKNLIAKAKYAITFGEGYDGYFIEPYLSGSISFTVLNTNFFPTDFPQMDTIYNSWDKMKRNIVNDIKAYDNDNNKYIKQNELMVKEIRKYTNNKQSEIDLLNLYNRFLGNGTKND